MPTHKTLDVNLPHAAAGELRLEAGGRRVLRVVTDLRPDQVAELAVLRAALARRLGPHGDYDGFIIDPKPANESGRA
ncbi:MAG: hypothetical protein E7774_12590 [Bradyrhizobium sp.]|nr:MAG: hypothetical protein E7774_12590 [Bradyrhizobium sp.]